MSDLVPLLGQLARYCSTADPIQAAKVAGSLDTEQLAEDCEVVANWLESFAQVLRMTQRL
jgi:hypothetical protein